MLWDIDSYIGDQNLNRITYQYDEDFNIFFLGCDFNLCDFDVFIENVKKNKKNLEFYDLENNMDFFNKLYNILGLIPYNENPLKTIVYNDLYYKYDDLIANLSFCLNNFFQDIKSHKDET
jgi:hypothetical protein